MTQSLTTTDRPDATPIPGEFGPEPSAACGSGQHWTHALCDGRTDYDTPCACTCHAAPGPTCPDPSTCLARTTCGGCGEPLCHDHGPADTFECLHIGLTHAECHTDSACGALVACTYDC